MIAAFAAVVALASPAPTALSPYDIVTRAQAAWEARVVPAYVSFEIPCADTFLDAQCAPKAIVNFVVRMSDGRTYAESIDLPKRQLMCGGFIYGPASTPFGFFRRIDANNVPSTLATPPPPENFAADPVRAQADRIGDRDGSRVHRHAIRDRESRRRIRLPPPSRTELYPRSASAARVMDRYVHVPSAAAHLRASRGERRAERHRAVSIRASRPGAHLGDRLHRRDAAGKGFLYGRKPALGSCEHRLSEGTTWLAF